MEDENQAINSKCKYAVWKRFFLQEIQGMGTKGTVPARSQPCKDLLE